MMIQQRLVMLCDVYGVQYSQNKNIGIPSQKAE
jgi:hypothetical protein